MKTYSVRHKIILPLILLCLVFTEITIADDKIDADEFIPITIGSLATFVIGSKINDIDSNKASIFTGPFAGEESIQRFFAGEFSPGKRNFLDDSKGSAYTSAACGLILLSSNLNWPRSRASNDASEDMFLYVSGLIATKGVTELAKGLFARPRPYMIFEPEYANSREFSEYGYDHNSFFSGHTSSAFFACSFLNMRIRNIMRREMSSGDYKNWRWAPPTVLFGWATYVGYSRIQAYKHYLSDVVIGALAGYLLSELFFSFSEESDEEIRTEQRAPLLFRVSFQF